MNKTYVYLLDYNRDLHKVDRDAITTINKTQLFELTELEGHEDVECTKISFTASEQDRLGIEAIYSELSVKEILFLINGACLI